MVLKEIYKDKEQWHRFDIIQCILNRDPHFLVEMERRARRWRSGLGGKNHDIILCRYTIGRRAFVLGYYFSKYPIDNEEWRERSRAVAPRGAGTLFGTIDYVVLPRCKRSGEQTFDGVSFFRLLLAPKVPA
jgi:hypothetical protein